MKSGEEAGSGDQEESCIFCAIAGGKTDAEVVFENNETIFFHDISPKASVHVVGIPKRHIVSMAEATEEEIAILAGLLRGVTAVADKLGLTEGGYRVITNVGSNAGQEVKHLHWHVLGGERLGPLRC